MRPDLICLLTAIGEGCELARFRRAHTFTGSRWTIGLLGGQSLSRRPSTWRNEAAPGCHGASYASTKQEPATTPAIASPLQIPILALAERRPHARVP